MTTEEEGKYSICRIHSISSSCAVSRLASFCRLYFQHKTHDNEQGVIVVGCKTDTSQTGDPLCGEVPLILTSVFGQKQTFWCLHL